MAKELPYFKFEPSEWLEGEIQICNDSSIVCFMNLCSGYWIKLGCISYAFALHKYFRKDESLLKELLDNNILKLVDGKIVVDFLDIQLKEFKDISIKRSEASKKRWGNNTEPELFNANVMQLESKRNPIREEKNRKEKIKKESNDKSKKDKIEGFVNWFNQSKKKHTGREGKFKMLSKTDENNLLKLLEVYNHKDFEEAIPKLYASEWAKENQMFTPTHFLRNNNFNKYLNQDIVEKIIPNY